MNKRENENLKLLKDSFQIIDISDEEYFGEKYKDYISNSSLAWINPSQNGDPYEYKYSNHELSTSSLSLGSIVHLKVLQNIDAKINVGKIPSSKKVIDIINELSKLHKKGIKLIDIAQELSVKYDHFKNKPDSFIKSIMNYSGYFYSKIRPENNTFYINQQSKEKLDLCQESISFLSDLLSENENSFNEKTILSCFEYKNSYNNCNESKILKVKCKIDNYKIDHLNKKIILNDLKTTSSDLDTFMETSFNKYHYNRQFSLYLYLLSNALSLEGYSLECNVYVLNTSNGLFKVFQILQPHIENGYKEWSDCIKRIGFHEMFGYNILLDPL